MVFAAMLALDSIDYFSIGSEYSFLNALLSKMHTVAGPHARFALYIKSIYSVLGKSELASRDPVFSRVAPFQKCPVD
jgi:hypothetical protein